MVFGGVVGVVMIATLAWVWDDARKKGKPRWVVVPFCLVTWPLGVALWSTMSSRVPGAPWPGWVKALLWLNAIVLLLLVAGLPTESAGGQLLCFAVLAAITYPLYRWGTRRLQVRTSRSSQRAP